MEAASGRFDINPSFSSSLLDEIYRSIDEKNDQKQSKFGAVKSNKYRFEDDYTHRRACLIQKLIQENKLREKTGDSSSRECDSRAATSLGSSACDSRATVKSTRYRYEGYYEDRRSCSVNSSSGECDSRAAEIESVYGIPAKPKPIRTNVKLNQEIEETLVKGKTENKFTKTKSKAFKIYSDLKKVNQPISPGGRLSTFLHSIFTGKTKTSNTAAVSGGDGRHNAAAMINLDRKSKSANASSCSSASSFSRSCLSNSSSSRGKLTNGVKRSVRFYPVSVIVDEDCKPCGEKSLREEVMINSNEKRRENSKIDREEEYPESDSSSDLFELDNLSVAEVCKYREELPLYETTYLDTNIAIAGGRFM